MKPALFTLILLLGTVGCGTTADLAPALAPYPAKWHGRSLYTLDGQWAYATDDSTAAELCLFAADVAREYTELTGETPVSPLLIARELDEPLFKSLEKELKYLFAEAAALSDEPVDPAAAMAEFSEQLRRDGVGPRVGLGLRPFAVRTSTLSPETPDATYPSQHAVIIATEDHREASIDAMIEGRLKRQGVGFGTRMIMSPKIASLRGTFRERMEVLSRMAIFTSAVRASDRPKEKKQQLLAQYLNLLEWEK
ncbi:MAG: hypothetical protein AAF488_16125 [Planctomycetota bacterium]